MNLFTKYIFNNHRIILNLHKMIIWIIVPMNIFPNSYFLLLRDFQQKTIYLYNFPLLSAGQIYRLSFKEGYNQSKVFCFDRPRLAELKFYSPYTWEWINQIRCQVNFWTQYLTLGKLTAGKSCVALLFK